MFEVQEVNVDLTKCSTAAETAGKKTSPALWARP